MAGDLHWNLRRDRRTARIGAAADDGRESILITCLKSRDLSSTVDGVPEPGHEGRKTVGSCLPDGPAGDIYVAWVDFPNGNCPNTGSTASPCTNADVRLTVSRDGGRSWSAPVRVHDDATRTDQFFPWMAAHPDGLVSIAWLDRRLDPDNIDLDVFYTNTYDGQTFLPNVRVNTVTSLLCDLVWIGDYQGIAATAGGVFPIWNDTRFGAPAVYFARGTLGP